MENAIRLAAFTWLAEQSRLHQDILPRRLLEQGFHHRGERVTLVGPAGIWKPRAFARIPLSITTVYNGPYADKIGPDNLISYSYRGKDIMHRDNVGLRLAMTSQAPLVYFHGLLPGKYMAVWPVFVVADQPDQLFFTVAVDEARQLEQPAKDLYLADSDLAARRRYLTASTRVRLHQRSFRERVLAAYREQCAFCRLRYTNLLDAAHIIADSQETGDPLVSNGLALCKIHHAAFDAHILGVAPDYTILVKEEILHEQDGPMLRHGIQELHRQKIILPASRKSWPDQERLARRFSAFQNAG